MSDWIVLWTAILCNMHLRMRFRSISAPVLMVIYCEKKSSIDFESNQKINKIKMCSNFGVLYDPIHVEHTMTIQFKQNQARTQYIIAL